MFDLSRLGAWRDLPFFDATLPGITTALEAETRTVFPPPALVFASLERTQPDDVKVVILGQDPYHTPGKAQGLAFSIPDSFGGRLDSLGNIIKELEDDLHVTRRQTDLTDWADQGVLLLNTVLTVPEACPQGHKALGWQDLTRQVITALADRPRAYLLWGKPAQALARDVDPGPNLKIETAHPSPLSAHRGFLGSRPFSQVNAWLQAQGQSGINWADS